MPRVLQGKEVPGTLAERVLATPKCLGRFMHQLQHVRLCASDDSNHAQSLASQGNTQARGGEGVGHQPTANMTTVAACIKKIFMYFRKFSTVEYQFH